MDGFEDAVVVALAGFAVDEIRLKKRAAFGLESDFHLTRTGRERHDCV